MRQDRERVGLSSLQSMEGERCCREMSIMVSLSWMCCDLHILWLVPDVLGFGINNDSLVKRSVQV